MSLTRQSTKARVGRQIVDESEEDEESGEGETGTDPLLSGDVILNQMKKQTIRRYIFVIITTILMIMDILMMIVIGVFYNRMMISNFLVSLTIHSKTSFNSDNVYTDGPSVMLGGVLLSLFIMSFLLKLVQVLEILSDTFASKNNKKKGRILRTFAISMILIDNGLHFQTVIFNGAFVGISSTFVLVSSGLGMIDNVVPCACLVIGGCFMFCCALLARSLELGMEWEIDLHETLYGDDDVNVIIGKTSDAESSASTLPSLRVRVIVFLVKITCYLLGCIVFLSSIIINFTSVNTLNLGTMTLTKATLYFSFPVVTLIFQLLFLLPMFFKMAGNLEWDVFEIMHSIHMELYLYVIAIMVIYGLIETNTFDQVTTLRTLLFGET